MGNLSIVIRDTEDKVYEHLESLKPLFEDNKIQLVLINNETRKFDIPYEYTHYEFCESYNRFIDFYEAICLYSNKLLIEKGIKLNNEVIKSIKQCIEDNKNFSVNIKKFISFDKMNYIMNDKMLMVSDNSRVSEFLNDVILED